MRLEAITQTLLLQGLSKQLHNRILQQILILYQPQLPCLGHLHGLNGICSAAH